jgi:hypothetical protein
MQAPLCTRLEFLMRRRELKLEALPYTKVEPSYSTKECGEELEDATVCLLVNVFDAATLLHHRCSELWQVVGPGS